MQPKYKRILRPVVRAKFDNNRSLRGIRASFPLCEFSCLRLLDRLVSQATFLIVEMIAVSARDILLAERELSG